jgi:hypothetical protein
MDSAALELSGELATELAANDQASRDIDPRSVPVRFSTLKMFSQSPAHYLHAARRGYDESLSMRIGSGAHAILFGQPYTTWTGKTRNGKIWDAFREEHSGELILNAKELSEAQAMVDAIRSHEIASRLLFSPGTVVEQRIDWQWQERAFRSTPDAANRTTCVDLKCLRSADPERVRWQSLKMFYHAQAALYRMALNSDGQHNIKENYLVVVENKAPYPVTVLRFKETALEMGERSLCLWMEQLRNCESSGAYPGYVQTIVDLEIPGDGLDGFTFEEDEEQQ